MRYMESHFDVRSATPDPCTRRNCFRWRADEVCTKHKVLYVFFLCFEEAVGHVLRVEYPAGSKPTSRPPPMKCLDLECNFEALGVKWRNTYDLKNCKLKNSTK